MNNLVIGVDIAKRVFQLHWVEESGEIKSVLSIGTVRNSGVSRCDNQVGAVHLSKISRQTPPNETVPNEITGYDCKSPFKF
jgi:hypothetical protein